MATISLRLLGNYAHFSGGFPDCVLWRIDVPSASGEKGEWTKWPGCALEKLPAEIDDDTADPPLALPDTFRAKAKFVEVKGPRDKLSHRQVAWLAVLRREAKVEAEVLRIDEPKRKRGE